MGHERPAERGKMHQWVKLGGYSLFLWWGFIGGIIMVYLYSVAGVRLPPRRLPEDGQGPHRRSGPGADGDGGRGCPRTDGGVADAALHHGHLYDAQFPLYDTFIGRTTTDAIATMRLRQGRVHNFLQPCCRPACATGRTASGTSWL